MTDRDEKPWLPKGLMSFGHGHVHGHSHGESVEHHGHGVSVLAGFVEDHEPTATPLKLEEGAGFGKILFLQLPSGIAGDMTIAALLDLGVPLQVVRGAVDALGLSDVELVVRRGFAGAIGCTHFDVRCLVQTKERSYLDIQALISHSALKPAVKELSLRIFKRLAQAEAEVHNTTIERVHFHEVGAVDSIVDVVGAAAAFNYLGATIHASPVPIGSGFVQCRHGVLPLPAPAALSCLIGVPTVDSGLEEELVTPTGAAIVATVAEHFASWTDMRPLRIGWGAGTKGLPDRPNAMRAILGEVATPELALRYALLEANLDDMSGELVAHALVRVMESGAVDCWIVPATMKKGRPGLVFCALAPVEIAANVADRILTETSSIGVRQSLVSRYELPRVIRTLETPLGSVRVKISGDEVSDPIKFKVEMDDCIRIAREQKRALPEVVAELNQFIRRALTRS